MIKTLLTAKSGLPGKFKLKLNPPSDRVKRSDGDYLSIHHFLNILDLFRYIRQILISLFGDDEIVFNSDAAKVQERLNFICIQVFRLFCTFQGRFEKGGDKINSR